MGDLHLLPSALDADAMLDAEGLDELLHDLAFGVDTRTHDLLPTIAELLEASPRDRERRIRRSKLDAEQRQWAARRGLL